VEAAKTLPVANSLYMLFVNLGETLANLLRVTWKMLFCFPSIFA